jgi:hypothetical protein
VLCPGMNGSHAQPCGVGSDRNNPAKTSQYQTHEADCSQSV